MAPERAWLAALTIFVPANVWIWGRRRSLRLPSCVAMSRPAAAVLSSAPVNPADGSVSSARTSSGVACPSPITVASVDIVWSISVAVFCTWSAHQTSAP